MTAGLVANFVNHRRFRPLASFVPSHPVVVEAMGTREPFDPWPFASGPHESFVTATTTASWFNQYGSNMRDSPAYEDEEDARSEIFFWTDRDFSGPHPPSATLTTP